MPKLRDDQIARFWSRVAVAGSDDCWEWKGALTPAGYGRFAPSIDGKGVRIFAHRVAFEAETDAIPDGLVIDHLCRNRACCNPMHLEVVTPAENILRGEGIAAMNAAKSVCDHGHPFDSNNTYVTPDGRRNCRTCRKDARARWRARAVA